MDKRLLSQPDNYYKDLIARLDQGYMLVEVLFDENDQPCDIYYIEANAAANRISGAELTGKANSALFLNFDQYLYQLFSRVAKTGMLETYEGYASHLNGYYRFKISKVGAPDERKIVVICDSLPDEAPKEAEQQREIFRTSLSTLEEERYRISESLHNGVGQILYGVKLALGDLKQELGEEEFRKAKIYTNKLIGDAIMETRRVSHELMPATLEQFGLKSAVEDICMQLSGEVKFTCTVRLPKKRLEKYLELAVYRTVQELMINVVKHAQALAARVEINVNNEVINIRVSDNGQGMEEKNKTISGIGLVSIRSKIKLLNGEMRIKSLKNNGTTVDIRIPIARIA